MSSEDRDKRKLASVEIIKSLRPIPGADRIETARVRGWDVVVRKDLHAVGDKVVYLEIDSFLPPVLPFNDLGLPLLHVEGHVGYRLRTIRLRGQWSQGLILPMSALSEDVRDMEVGTDLTERLAILLYEDIFVHPDPRLSAFPSRVPKTSLDRVQNLEAPLSGSFSVTYKLDGESITLLPEGVVCSKDWRLSEDHPTSRAVLSKVDPLPGYAVQGEWYKGNLFVFRLFPLEGEELSVEEQLQVAASAGYVTVPRYDIRTLENASHEYILELTERATKGSEMEGLVWKGLDNDLKFKSISNRYLLKQE